jgi:hypothetical protein
MNTAEYVTTIVCLTVFFLATVLALVWYLGRRIDRAIERAERPRATGTTGPPLPFRSGRGS